MANTIIELTPAQIQRLVYSKRMRHTAPAIDLTLDQLYALSLITLNNAVVPDDYPTLKANIEGVTGVQNISLLVDRRTVAELLQPNTKLTATISIDLNIVDVPEES